MPGLSGTQQTNFSTMSFSNALTSLSNALSASNPQSTSFSQVHKQAQQMAAMQQANRMTPPVDLLLQQQHQVQQHLKQQAILQQQQQLQKQQLQQQQRFPNMSITNSLGAQGMVYKILVILKSQPDLNSS